MVLGVTGTRDGLTVEQFQAMTAWMRSHPFTGIHHGCCIGADAEAFEAASSIRPGAQTVAHPPTSRRLVSENTEAFSDVRCAPLPYLERNRAIVDACDTLLVLPRGDCEEQRSGTWSTCRYARKVGKPVVICWPDGTVTED